MPSVKIGCISGQIIPIFFVPISFTSLFYNFHRASFGFTAISLFDLAIFGSLNLLAISLTFALRATVNVFSIPKQ